MSTPRAVSLVVSGPHQRFFGVLPRAVFTTAALLVAACSGPAAAPPPKAGPPAAASEPDKPKPAATPGECATPAAAPGEVSTSADNPPKVPTDTLPMGSHTLVAVIERGKHTPIPAEKLRMELTVMADGKYRLEEHENGKLQRQVEGIHQVTNGLLVLEGEGAPPFAMAVAYDRGRLLLCRSALAERGEGTGTLVGTHTMAPVTHLGHVVDQAKVPPAKVTFAPDGTLVPPSPPKKGAPRYAVDHGVVTILNCDKTVEHNALGYFGERLVLCRTAWRALAPPAMSAATTATAR